MTEHPGRRSGRKARTAGEPAPSVSLEAKLKPSQSRAHQTFEAILAVSGELLAEVGFERLSTNLVCQRAGLTPPALYRYFPNKYAILSELGRRLMDAQDRAVFDWIEAGGLVADSMDEAIAKNREIQETVNQITRDMPGGVWILRAMRAVPMLQDIRIASRDKVARHTAERLLEQYPASSTEEIYAATRITTELMMAATEMVLEQPDADEALVTQEVCRMVCLYYSQFAGGKTRYNL
ncbi:TetR/AcrR family transcriptional regulator [uncultured Brevundimonas sp.]|jgi:AcrR family transcriptional regulator|uniref:TetR/AcrR family transcriptional regulator n=1 Tax=uncultured Brevundimonas sp. TaxID=213418 RepID=UPI000DB8B6CB|nr:TetR/AcrR family transcriptional regulator [uncultured Brevundimonas sp.]PZU00143.1 MAG: TetR family transcriptional regulator [Brevundimonas sp.]